MLWKLIWFGPISGLCRLPTDTCKMETCRVCEENFESGRTRPKEAVQDILLQTYGIDIGSDPEWAPQRIHQKCYMKLSKGQIVESVRNYQHENDEAGDGEADNGEDGNGEGGDGEGGNGEDGNGEDGDGEGGDRDNQDEDDLRGGEDLANQFCKLCQNEIEAPKRRDRITAGVMEQLKQIYGVPENTLEPVGEILFLCGACRNILKKVVSQKEPPSTLPNLVVTLKPSWSPTNITARPERRKKELLNMKCLTGKHRKRKDRPELANILGQIEEFCKNQEYNTVELGFFILYKFLSSASKFTMARQLKLLYNNKTKNISPRKSVANKYFAGRSHRDHRSLALFLRQQLGRKVFPSRDAEDRFVESLQPRSYSYKLYSLSEDPECLNPFKEVQGLQRPPDPDVAGMSKTQTEAARAEHRLQVKEYKKGLETKTFEEQYLNKHSESPLPNSLVAIEDYAPVLWRPPKSRKPFFTDISVTVAQIQKLKKSGAFF